MDLFWIPVNLVPLRERYLVVSLDHGPVLPTTVTPLIVHQIFKVGRRHQTLHLREHLIRPRVRDTIPQNKRVMFANLHLHRLGRMRGSKTMGHLT